ncbi:MAG: hypothetical protein U0610_31080 [bacterium]
MLRVPRQYSYGIYLLHLPFVMYAGGRMRALPTGTFVLAASGVVALVVAGSVAVEHAVERSTDRWLGGVASAVDARIDFGLGPTLASHVAISRDAGRGEERS